METIQKTVLVSSHFHLHTFLLRAFVVMTGSIAFQHLFVVNAVHYWVWYFCDYVDFVAIHMRERKLPKCAVKQSTCTYACTLSLAGCLFLFGPGPLEEPFGINGTLYLQAWCPSSYLTYSFKALRELKPLPVARKFTHSPYVIFIYWLPRERKSHHPTQVPENSVTVYVMSALFDCLS